MSSRKHRAGPLANLANLAAAISPSRLGTASPGASQPLASAPRRTRGKAGRLRAGALSRSLRACTAEGLLAEVIGACASGAILTAWALYLEASTLLTGTLLALSQLAQLFQFPAAFTTSWLGHRRACLVLVAASRQALLPLVALPFLPLSADGRQTLLLTFAALSSVLGVLGNNAWVAWMSELVPKRVRGRYFGRRTAYCTLGGALSSAAVGCLLDTARSHGQMGSTLALLQLVGSLCGLATLWLMLRQHDPRPEHSPLRLDWSKLLAPFRDRSARGLLLYLAAWNGAVGLAGSFFALHMVRNLHMGFTLVALHGTAVAVVRMLVAPVFGNLLDRLGARPVLIACSFGISSIPFLWLFPAEGRLWPLVFDVLVAGVLWCGHALAIFHLPLTIAPRAQRPFYLAAFAAVSGLSYSAATIAGGLLSDKLPEQLSVLGHPLHGLQLIFAISGLLRLLAAFTCLRLEEPASQTVNALFGSLRDMLQRHLPRGERWPALSPRSRLAARRPDNDNAPTSRADCEESAA